MQDRGIIFTKTFKTFPNFIWIEIIFVKRRNITVKPNMWIAFRIIKNYNSQQKDYMT